MAQIIAYHNYIKPDAPGKPSAFNSASIGQWGGTYNLTAIRNMEYITNTSPPAVKGQVAVLMHQLGVNSLADYYPNLTYNRTMDYIRDGFARMGYTVTNYGKATGLSETANSSTITYYTSPAVIKDALNNNRPVFTRGGLADNSGHFWVIDGYGSMTTYREYFYNTSTGKYGYVTITLTNCLMVHCNLGWDGNANGWYVYGIFDTDNRTLLESGAGTGAGNYSTNTYVLIPKKP
jgi:hypothetical protein